MKKQMKIGMFWSLLALSSGVLLSCQDNKKQNRQPPGSTQGNMDTSPVIKLFTDNPFAGQENLKELLETTLQSGTEDLSKLDPTMIYALSQCAGCNDFEERFLKNLAQKKGVLPQILVPSIREEVKSNTLLKFVLNTIGPNSLLGWLAGALVTNEKIDAEIKKGLDKKVNDALLTSGTLESAIGPYQFDLFKSPFASDFTSTETASSFFITKDLGLKWNYIFSRRSGLAPAAQMDNAKRKLHLFQVANSLAEITYLLGLDQATGMKTPHYGGLTIKLDQGLNAPLTSYDPRTNSTSIGIVTGNYLLRNENFQNKSLQQILVSNESWERQGKQITLEEQLYQWQAAARLYNLLAPSRREVTSIFRPDTGIFPGDAHQVSLAFLLSMAELLGKHFINLEELEIYNATTLDPSRDTFGKPGPLPILRLAQTMGLWILALQNVEKDQLDPEILKQIQDNIVTIKDLMRLAVRIILAEFVTSNHPTYESIAVVKHRYSNEIPSFTAAAETLYTLTWIDRNIFEEDEGTDFQTKVVGLVHWFVSTYLADIHQDSAGRTPAGVLFSALLLEQANRYEADEILAPWLPDALAQFEGVTK